MHTQSESLTISELLDRSGLELSCVGGAAGREAVIGSIYIGDLQDPLPWMAPDSLLLTTGPGFVDRPQECVTLIERLREHEMAGLGIAITPHVDEIHPDWIAAADRAGLALLQIPPQTPFRLISDYVHNSLASRDLRRLRQSLSLQNTLLGALREGGRVGLIRRLATYTGVPVINFGADGQVLTASGRVDPASLGELWQAYRHLLGEGRPRSVFTWQRHTVVFREVCHGAEMREVLMSLRRPEEGVGELPEAAMAFAHRLLELELDAAEAALGRQRSDRDRLFHELLFDDAPGDIELHLARHRLVHPAHWFVLVVETDRGAPLPTAAAMDAGRLLEYSRVPFLRLLFKDRLLLMVEVAPEGLPALTGELEGRLDSSSQAAGPTLRIGVAGPAGSTAGVRTAVAEAMVTLRLGRDAGRRAGVQTFGDLSPFQQVLSHLDGASLRAVSDAVCRPLRDHDTETGSDLLATLTHYVHHGCSAAGTAEAMHLHRNALRKRLARVESIIGVELSSTDGLTDVNAALTADAVLTTRKLLSLT